MADTEDVVKEYNFKEGVLMGLGRSFTVLESTLLNASYKTDPIAVKEDNFGSMVQWIDAGGLAGTVKIQGSTIPSAAGADWQDITGASATLGATNNWVDNYTKFILHYIRFVITITGGSGTFKIMLNDKKWH